LSGNATYQKFTPNAGGVLTFRVINAGATISWIVVLSVCGLGDSASDGRNFSDTCGSRSHCVRVLCGQILPGLHASAAVTRKAYGQVAGKDDFCFSWSCVHTLRTLRLAASLIAPQSGMGSRSCMSVSCNHPGRTKRDTQLLLNAVTGEGGNRPKNHLYEYAAYQGFGRECSEYLTTAWAYL
jgi:hypothetical protein